MVRTNWRVTLILLAVMAVLAAMAVVQASPPGGAQAAPPAQGGNDKPVDVKSNSDAARSKIHPKLREQLDSGSTDVIYVYATVGEDTREAAGYLDDVKVAHEGGAGLLVGRIGVQELPKLASAKDVVSVGPIEFEQTGEPEGVPDPELGKLPDSATKDKILRGLYEKEVPYGNAPPLAGSNFEELKELALLDTKTHKFAEAWEAGYTGAGTSSACSTAEPTSGTRTSSAPGRPGPA